MPCKLQLPAKRLGKPHPNHCRVIAGSLPHESEREREREREREGERYPRVGPSAAGVHDMLTRRNVGPNAYPAVAAQVHNQQFVDESGG